MGEAQLKHVFGKGRTTKYTHLETGYIEFARGPRLEYYADAIHSAIVNPAAIATRRVKKSDPPAFFFWVRSWLGVTFNYLILWVRVKGQG